MEEYPVCEKCRKDMPSVLLCVAGSCEDCGRETSYDIFKLCSECAQTLPKRCAVCRRVFTLKDDSAPGGRHNE